MLTEHLTAPIYQKKRPESVVEGGLNINNYTKKPIFLRQAKNILSNLQESNINTLWQSDRRKHFITRNSAMKDTFVILGNTKVMMRASSWQGSTVLKSFNQHWLKRSHFFSRSKKKLGCQLCFGCKTQKRLWELRSDQLLFFVDCCMQLDL